MADENSTPDDASLAAALRERAGALPAGLLGEKLLLMAALLDPAGTTSRRFH
jgi:hypothetical protein